MSELELVDRTEFWSRLKEGEAMDCPCCDRYAKIYRRRIHNTAARGLILLYKLGGMHDYVHSHKLILPGQSAPGDMMKTKHWGLVVNKPVDDDEKKSSGWWKLTADGVAFIQNKKRVPKYALIYDDTLLSFEGGDVGIQEALGTSFDYGKLMSERVEL